jgi:hypothetical protein
LRDCGAVILDTISVWVANDGAGFRGGLSTATSFLYQWSKLWLCAASAGYLSLPRLRLQRRQHLDADGGALAVG